MARQWTEEEKKAFGEKMKALREKKAQQAPEQPTEQNPTVEIPADKLDELMKRLERLEAEKQQSAVQSPTISKSGHIVGIQEKFPTNKAMYLHLDPRERLFNEPEFQRFAPRDNFSLYWDIKTTTYENKQGIHYSEPRFELEIRRKQLNDDGSVAGEYVLGKHISHEDPDAAIELAQALNIDVDPQLGTDFLDEMRYQVWKMFVKELFYPPKQIQQVNGGKKEMVVGGRVVTFYENPRDLNSDLSGV